MSTVEEFERRYRVDPDPWRFTTSAYEQRRYDVTVACLPEARYRRGFEPGCAVGELSRRLAGRCDALVAWDGAPTVVDVARQRLAAWPNVEVDVGAVPVAWPEGTFDLIVLSEIGYYFERLELGRLVARSIGSLESGGTLLATHWLGRSPDHALHGDDVHDVLGAELDLVHDGAFRDAGFRVDWWIRR